MMGGLERPAADEMVSVVVPAWNSSRFVGEAIASVLGQTVTVNEIVVVDDGSTDDTLRELHAIAANEPLIRIVEQANTGPGGARDRGVAETSGSLIAFLDADDVWLPTKLERQIELLKQRPDVGATFTLAQNFFDGVAPSGPTVPMTGYLPSALVARREVVLATGSFATEGAIADWVPWFLRLRDTAEIAVVDELLLNRRVHGENLTTRHASDRSAYATHVLAALRRRRLTAAADEPGPGPVES